MSGPAIFISVDMEGVAGVARLNNTAPGHSTYPRGQVLMTEEANAAIAGAFDAGASRVVVADSHGAMDNILPELLDPRATLIQGSPRTCGMISGLTDDLDGVLLVGYHAAAGRPGVLAHTFTGFWSELRINGVSQSEADVNALRAGEMGVPVKLLTGDDQTCAAGVRGTSGVHVVSVKDYLSYNSALSLSPTAARERIRNGASAAVSDNSIAPVRVPEELTLEVDLKAPSAAELVAAVPTVERLNEHTVRVVCADLTATYDFVAVAGALAAQAAAVSVRPEP